MMTRDEARASIISAFWIAWKLRDCARERKENFNERRSFYKLIFVEQCFLNGSPLPGYDVAMILIETVSIANGLYKTFLRTDNWFD